MFYNISLSSLNLALIVKMIIMANKAILKVCENCHFIFFEPASFFSSGTRN
jgi:hypothetical protein